MKSLTLITSLVLAATIASPADEASALAVLASDAGTEKKVQACNELAVVGTTKSIPALAKLLGDEKLSTYARSALEVMPDPAATKALLDALPNLEDDRLAGVVTSLGYRGDASAVPALQKLATPASGVCEQAFSALAMIGDLEGLQTILAVLKDGDAKCKPFAAHAALLASERLKKAGKSPATMLDAIQAADVPASIKAAAKAMN
jgi:hypothetical protein